MNPTPEAQVPYDVALSIEEADLDDPAELPPDGDDSTSSDEKAPPRDPGKPTRGWFGQ